MLALVYIGVRLQDCCSIFNRFDMKETDISKLNCLAVEYFRYGQGFLTVTMEGRKQNMQHYNILVLIPLIKKGGKRYLDMSS